MEHRTGMVNDLHVAALDNPSGFPLLIEWSAPSERGSELEGVNALLDLWTSERTWIDTELRRYGAILFRGFDVSGQAQFQHLMTRSSPSLVNYVDGNSPRTKVDEGLYTSTEYPPEFFISLHNELSYSSQWPARVFFCCVTPPGAGGETALVDSRVLLHSLPDNLVEEFRSKQVRYIRNLHGGKGFGPSWQKTFETTDRGAVEAYAKKAGMQLDWLPDGSVRLTNVRPATTLHPVTREEVWFNQADQFHPSTHPASIYESMAAIYKGREDLLPQNATFGDGSPIPLEYLTTIRAVTSNHLVAFTWKQGDLLMVDNTLVAHGRMPFKGPRKILVSMTSE